MSDNQQPRLRHSRGKNWKTSWISTIEVFWLLARQNQVSVCFLTVSLFVTQVNNLPFVSLAIKEKYRFDISLIYEGLFRFQKFSGVMKDNCNCSGKVSRPGTI